MSEEQNNESAEPKLPTGEVGKEEKEGLTNPAAVQEVSLDNPLKEWFVEYVGEKYKPEGGVVTVELAIRAFAEEFPEFLMVLAEENWIRGYQQGVNDSEEGVRMALESAGVDPEDATTPFSSAVQEIANELSESQSETSEESSESEDG